MTFAWPQLLWLLALPLFWVAWELARARRATAASSRPKILRAQVGSHDLSLVRDTPGTRASRVRPWLMLGLAFAIVALARPQWGRIEEPVFDQAREILLAVDLSRSMLSPDVKPSRLDRAKLLIQALLEKLKGERVGLVVFSGTAFLQSPLSSDYEILREFLPSLGPDFLPEGGTNYRALIDTSLDAFGESGAADRFLIVLSDGEATDDEWQSRVAELKKKGVRVIGLGIGTAAGTMIPDGSGGFVKDSRGAVVMSKLESGTLQALAAQTGGVYRDASAWIDLASLVDETVNAGKKGDFADKNTVRLVDRFQWPLALALWCFLVSFYYEFPVRPRPRDIALRPHTPSPTETPAARPNATGTASLLLLGLLAFVVIGRPAYAAVKVAPPAPPPALARPGAPARPESAPPGSPVEAAQTLGKVVSRLSQKEALTAPDLSEFAHETLNWGRRVREGGAPVPPGPVRDALAAVDELESHGNKMSDWAQLRNDLEELLQKPPEQQKEQQSQDQQNKQQQQQQQQNGGGSSQKQSDPQKQDQPQDKPQENNSQQNQSQQNQSQQPQKSDSTKSDQPAFGDMTKPQPPPPAPGETQKVGGAPDKPQQPPQSDPALALPMEKLDQLKDQDSPAQLFQMMQADRSQASRKKPQKDW